MDIEEVRKTLLVDPTFRQRYGAEAALHDTRFRETIASYLVDAIPVLDELEKHGFLVPRIGGLGVGGVRYDDAIPLLMRWAKQLPLGRAWEDVLGRLAQPWAKKLVGPFLLELYATRPAGRSSIASCFPAVSSAGLESSLLQLLRESPDEEGGVRSLLVHALSKVGTKASVAAILRHADDRDARVRTAVAVCLGKHPSKEAMAALERLKLEPNLREQAESSLAKVTKKLATC